MTRLVRAWGALDFEQRVAALAALALLITMFLPWYELQSLNPKTKAIESRTISAFGDVSFVEAAVFLVAVGVMVLLFARAERRDFHMPGSDGLVVLIAGGWAALLIFYRVFSRPSGHGYPVGIQWGFFLAFVAAGALGFAGWRMRTYGSEDPPLARSRPRPRPHRANRNPATHDPAPTEVTEVTRPLEPKPHTPAAASARQQQRRPRYPPSPAEQLSFEDAPIEPDEG